MARIKSYQKQRFNEEKSNLWITDEGLIRVNFADGSVGYMTTHWVFNMFGFTRTPGAALKIIDSNDTIDDSLFLKFIL